MAALRRHWIAGLLGVIGLLGLVSALNVGVAIGQPFGGFYTNRSHALNLWLVDAPTPPWWPGIAAMGLRYEDVLLALDGEPYGPDAHRKYAEAAHAGRSSVRLTIRRDGQTLDVDAPLVAFTPSHFSDIKLPDLITGLGFWLLAVAVYGARPAEPVNRQFALAASLMASGLWLSIPALFPESGAVTRFLHLAWVFTATFVGVSAIHLALLFPEPTRRIPLRWLGAPYVLMALVAGLYALSHLLHWQNTAPAAAELLSTLGNEAVIGAFGLGVGVYTGRLLWLIGHPARSRRTRRQAMLMLWGVICALPYAIVVIFRAFVGGTQSYFWNGLDLRYIVLAVPLSSAFVILRYQTSGRTHPLLIRVFILASSALAASVSVWIMRLLEPGWMSVAHWPPFVPIFVAAVFSGWLWRRQSSWQGALSRLFQWDKRSYTAARQFGQQVVSQSDLDLVQLPHVIASALVDKLELERAVVWLWDEGTQTYHRAAHAGEWKHRHSLPARLTPGGPPRLAQSLSVEGEALPAWLAPMRAGGAVVILTPLWMSERPIGLLGLGKRWDEEIFDERDLEIIDLIAQQSALFLLAALTIEQLRQVPHQIATGQERERFKIAQELHDTIQQFLGRLPFYLEVSRNAARTNPAEAETLLQRCIADVESAAQTVRQIRNNLAPLQLEKSLIQPMQMLVEHFQTRNGVNVRMDIAPEVEACLSPEARHALYRVVQQALDNVAEHAHARQVTISLTQDNGRIEFAVVADGVGSTDEARTRAADQGSFGLQSMQARIAALGGEFGVRSAPGEGTQLSGWLPIRKDYG